ncbi:hypothetical protein N6H18_09950 [Reichenbachiella agarivorans]|uniref:Uncharacterized protein n=1 Tax=Reichenbachiella agarivorans TaxID=2979464 RepID=A0ABY6CJH9_9BACT|nr:hypothetical protein [Reichenbachiella agarivorans]UXP30676.1 hypothetical protein N6H18_09950 [Reichenbachiella agarivorans]
MKKITLILMLTLAAVSAMAQTEALWKSNDLVIEETTDESGNRTYSLFAKEMKYTEMYYLLTVSSGGIQEVYNDVLYFEKYCSLSKGTNKNLRNMDIASRDEQSIFIVVTGEVGFTILHKHDLKRVQKALEKRAELLAITLDQSPEILGSL